MTANAQDLTQFQALFENAFTGHRIHAKPEKGGTRIWDPKSGATGWTESARSWMNKQRECNFYFSPALVKPGRSTTKKDDMRESRYLWADLDPRKDRPLDEERANILALLTDDLPYVLLPPTFIVDSGRGFWAYWGLIEPHVFDGDNGDATRDFEAVLRGIGNAFGEYGDRSVKNINRITRLPGSTNLKTGAPAQVIAYNPVSYALDQFPKAVVERVVVTRDDTDVEPLLTDLLQKMLAATPYVGGPEGLDDRRSDAGWLQFMMAVHEACDGDADGLALFSEWSGNDEEYTGNSSAELIEARWNSLNAEAIGGVTRATWIKLLAYFGNADLVSDAMGEPNAKDEFAGVPIEPFKPVGNPAKIAKEKVEREAVIEDKKARNNFLDMLQGYTLCTSPVVYIRREDHALVNEKAFRAMNNPYTAQMRIAARYKDDASKYVQSLPFGQIERVRKMCYRPGQEQLVEGMANMWTKPPITPLDEEPMMFLDHVDYLIPDPVERELLLNWMAHCIQKPMIKLMFALLIVDEKGRTGKSWLGYLMRVLLGRQNVVMLAEDDPVTSDFNAWSLNKSFGFIHEILPSGKSDIIMKLKGVITEDTRSINMKGIERHDAENRTNLMGATNHAKAVRIAQDDGRWAVVKGATDKRFCDDDGKPTDATVAYYVKLFACIGTPETPGDEARRVLAWMMKRDLSQFNGQGAAPQTNAKTFVADVTQGNWAAMLTEAKATKQAPFTRELFTAQEALEVLALRYPSAQQSDVRNPALSEALIESGCRKIEGQIYVLGKRLRLWTLSPGLAKKYGEMKPAKLGAIFEEMMRRTASSEFDDKTEPTTAEPGAAAQPGDDAATAAFLLDREIETLM
jgi:hypothetical protein